MGKAKFTAKVVPGAARAFRRGATWLRGGVRRELQQDLLPRLVRVSRQAAPERSGRLARGLQGRPSARGGGTAVEVISTVRSPRGYSYTGVTRFGHRQQFITPKRKKALAFSIGGKRLVRKKVRGYHPSHDWADDAQRLAQPHVARSARNIGRDLQAAIG